MTIQPPLECPAEQRPALDPIDWRSRLSPPAGIDAYPVPEHWCYACCRTHAEQVVTCHNAPLPEPTDRVLTDLAYNFIPGQLALPLSTDSWVPAHVEAVRALVEYLQTRIVAAERAISGR